MIVSISSDSGFVRDSLESSVVVQVHRTMICDLLEALRVVSVHSQYGRVSCKQPGQLRQMEADIWLHCAGIDSPELLAGVPEHPHYLACACDINIEIPVRTRPIENKRVKLGADE